MSNTFDSVIGYRMSAFRSQNEFCTTGYVVYRCGIETSLIIILAHGGNNKIGLFI